MPLLDIFQDRSIHDPTLHPFQFSFQRLLVSRCHRLVHGPLPHLGLEFRSANGPIDDQLSLIDTKNVKHAQVMRGW